jgi:hypothetical protein
VNVKLKSPPFQPQFPRHLIFRPLLTRLNHQRRPLPIAGPIARSTLLPHPPYPPKLSERVGFMDTTGTFFNTTFIELTISSGIECACPIRNHLLRYRRHQLLRRQFILPKTALFGLATHFLTKLGFLKTSNKFYLDMRVQLRMADGLLRTRGRLLDPLPYVDLLLQRPPEGEQVRLRRGVGEDQPRKE